MKVIDNSFDKHLIILGGLEQQEYMSLSMSYFDRDGFELNELEQRLYKHNGIKIDEKHLNHVANHFGWIECTSDDPRLIIDHSCMAQRWTYEGEARRGLVQACLERNELRKLLNIKPKWGLDFNLDYIGPDNCMELVHIECDRNSYDEIMELKYKAEKLILNTDWMQVYKHFNNNKNKWIDMPADDQIEWKVQYVGWPRTYDTRKVFA